MDAQSSFARGISGAFWLLLSVPAMLLNGIGMVICFIAKWVEIFSKDLKVAIERREFGSYIISLFLLLMAILAVVFLGAPIFLRY